MANYQFTADILADVFFRSEEISSASAFTDAILRYINRAYQAIWMGGGEFLSGSHEDWLWLRTPLPAIILQEPIYDVGTVDVGVDFPDAVFDPAPAISLQGYILSVENSRQMYHISFHDAGNPTATLDSIYLDETNFAASFSAFKTIYPLPMDFLRFSQPARMYQGNYTIDGVDEDTLDEQYPVARISSGLPKQFALISRGESTSTAINQIRFSHAGDDQGRTNRIEYHYLRRPADLTSPGTTEEPLVPFEYRRIIADGALFWMHRDKNDNRAVQMGESFQAGIRAMIKDNQYQLGKMDSSFGKIMPRTPPRTRPQVASDVTRQIGARRP